MWVVRRLAIYHGMIHQANFYNMANIVSPHIGLFIGLTSTLREWLEAILLTCLFIISVLSIADGKAFAVLIG